VQEALMTFQVLCRARF